MSEIHEGQSVRYLFKEGAIQDGELKDCGRIIAHDGRILVSYNNRNDHNDLLRAFASRYQMNRDEVINEAVRLYFRIDGQNVIVTGVRQIDNEKLKLGLGEYGKLIASVIR
jgi:hypothetical protein